MAKAGRDTMPSGVVSGPTARLGAHSLRSFAWQAATRQPPRQKAREGAPKDRERNDEGGTCEGSRAEAVPDHRESRSCGGVTAR